MTDFRITNFLHMKLTLLASLILIFSLQSCYYDVEEELYPDIKSPGECDTTDVRYSVDIIQIFNSRCNSCHSGVNASAGIRLDSYQEVKSYLDLNGSRLISSIKQDGNASPMPQGQPPIPPCEILKIETWFNNNYPEN
jgi:hypothetical protein